MSPVATPAPYDAIAQDYQRSRASPLRTFIESHTLWSLLGPVAGLAVLDVGCGEGCYARQLKAAGAARVVGVDLSPAMLDLARAAERATPQGIEYHCAPAEALPELGGPGGFDVVLAAYLLHYAPDLGALGQMTAGLARKLRPGGRLVALVENPEQPVTAYPGYAQYGFNKVAVEPRQEGSRIRYGLVAGRRMIHFDTFYYSRSAYESVLGQAGFRRLAWHRPRLDPGAPADFGSYWDEYLQNPPVLGLTGTVGEGGA